MVVLKFKSALRNTLQKLDRSGWLLKGNFKCSFYLQINNLRQLACLEKRYICIITFIICCVLDLHFTQIGHILTYDLIAVFSPQCTDRFDVSDDHAAGDDDDAEGNEEPDGEEENIVADLAIQPVGAAARNRLYLVNFSPIFLKHK